MVGKDDAGGGFRVLHMRLLATAGLTENAFVLVEDVRDEGQGAPAHIHRRSDEAFYVLAGRFAFTRGDEELEATAGTFVFIPKGTRHRYRALDNESRVLIFYVPAGGFDDFLRDLDGLLATGLTSAEAIARLRGKYDSDPA